MPEHSRPRETLREKGASALTDEELVSAVPPLSVQRTIVASLAAERALVESNRKLIEIFEAKIKAKLDEGGFKGSGVFTRIA